MEFEDEKTSNSTSGPSNITRSLTRLRLEAEQDLFTLKHHTKEFQRRSGAVSRPDGDRMLQRVLLFIANAPAELLRQLSGRLRALSRRLRVKIQHGVWRLPRLLVGDVVRFEDALGRRSNLPWEYFRYWALLKPFLAHIFEGLPGHYQIVRDRYRLLHNRTDQLMTEPQWSRLVRSGDRITMSMVSHVSSKDQRLDCPTCNVTMAQQDDSLSQVKCSNCDSTYRLLGTTSHPHVMPSDGFYIPLPTLVQRRIEDVNIHVVGSSQGSQDDAEMISSSTNDTHDYDKLRTNLGLSKLKHVLIQPTQNPCEIVDAIEELLDERMTTVNGTTAATDPFILRLRATNELIRKEMERRNELNYLDFKAEHETFMKHSHAALQHLKSTSRSKDPIHPVSNGRNTLRVYSNWVRDHYSLTSDPFNTNSMNTDNYTDSVLVLMKTLVGGLLYFRLPRALTVKRLKESYAHRHGAPVQQQYLVYRGRKLEDHLTLGHYGVGPEYYVHVLLPIWRSRSTGGR